MYTTIEGDWDEVKAVVKGDIRPGSTDGLTSKVETIERYMAP